MENAPQEPPTESEVIVCKVTPWYYRRMALLFVLLLGFSLLFFYDGKFGYPNDNEKVHAKAWFDTEYLTSFENAKAQGQLDQWIAKAKAAGQPTGENGEPPRWATFATQKGWAVEPPKHHSEAEIAQQFQWGYFLLLGDLVIVVLVFLNRGKTFVGHLDHMVMPNGKEVRYAEVFKVDKRRWEFKGLAYAYYRHDGREARATVDDLKYHGAHRVLKRLLSHFTGELIEKAPDEDEEKAKKDDPKSTPPATQV
jgi:hypothetical protein